jgi:hypothetical protein
MYTFDEEGYKIKTGQCELKKVSSSSFSAGKNNNSNIIFKDHYCFYYYCTISDVHVIVFTR